MNDRTDRSPMPPAVRLGLLLAMLLLAACQGTAGPSPPSPRAGAAVRSSSRPPASPTPTLSPVTPAGSPLTALARYLARPATPVRTITGAVTIDARYAVDASAGRILSNNGANVIDLGGSAIVSNNGANLISDHGGGVVSNNGGNLISDQGGSVVSNNGGSFVSKTRGANLISDRGDQAQANWRRDYSLTTAEASVGESPATRPPSLGTLAPAAGMAIRAFDLESGAFVPLGAMPDGGPAYEILSDGLGAYTLFLPQESRTVMLLATPPDRDDARLTYSLLLGRKPLTTEIDEDTAMATRVIRRGYVRAWIENLSPPRPSPTPLALPSVMALPASTPAPVAPRDPRVIAGWRRVAELAASSGAHRLSAEARKRLAERIADVELAYSHPETTHLARTSTLFPYDGPDETVFDAYKGVMKTYREALTETLRAMVDRGEDPLAYLAQRPYVIAANRGRPDPYVFKKPGDVLEFVVDHYVLNSGQTHLESLQGMLEVITDLDLPVAPIGRLLAALEGSQADADRVFFLEDGGALAVVETLIVEAGRTAP